MFKLLTMTAKSGSFVPLKMIDMKKYLLFALPLVLAACGKDPDYTGTKQTVVNDYATLVHANYEDALTTAEDLETALQALVNSPSQITLDAARTAWIDARAVYGQTEAFRFYGGPIDSDTGPEGLINAWPMDESFIDYIDSDPNSGIINDTATYPTLDAALLESLNENGSETNIACGYHAIEFLLWGQDLSASGPGNRPYTDYVTDGSGTAANQARRGQYLLACASLLIDNLSFLESEWATGGSYRTTFTSSANTDQSLGYILRGIGALSKGELAGERMTVALNTQDQEDEHSCFSDNTHNDIIANFYGIKNVYLGTYVRADGSVLSVNGLQVLFAETDATKNQAVLAALAAAENEIDQIPAPFDQAILSDPGMHIENSVENLRDLSDALVDVALSVGITVNTEIL